MDYHSKLNGTQNWISLKMECHLNGMLFKMECHSKLTVAQNGMSLKMEFHPK